MLGFNALNGLLSFLLTLLTFIYGVFVGFQRPERASLISTTVRIYEDCELDEKFQRPERASLISTKINKENNSEMDVAVSTP